MISENREMLQELNYLIEIRRYLTETMGNPVLDRKVITEMNHTLLLVDEMIVSKLQSPEFKEFVGFENIKEVVRKAAKTTNIKSGLVNK